MPDEVAADRAAQLELVALPHLPHQVGRNLAFLQALHGQRDCAVLGRRGDRVAALRLVPIFGREPDVDVLAGQVAGPLGHLEDQRADVRGLRDEFAHPAQTPGEPPPNARRRRGRQSPQ